MINFDALTLKVFNEENHDFFSGAKIQKVQQPGRSELIFYIRNKGQSRKFYINFNPIFYHLCFMSEKNEKKRNIKIPKSAPMFCMLLRKYIQNAVILDTRVPEAERIFEIYFDYYDELNEKITLCLAVELMGKYSNVILYNYDTNVIIGCAHNVSSEKSRDRELAGLMPYIYPKKQNKKNLLNISESSFVNSIKNDEIVKSISSKYNYLTMCNVEMFQKIVSFPYSHKKLYLILKDFLSSVKFQFYILNDFSKYFLFKTDNAFCVENINEMIDCYFAYHQNLYLKENLRQKIIKHINIQIKKLELLKSKQEEQIKKHDKAIEYKNKGDILIANSYSIKNVVPQIILYDFDGNKLSIDLDINLNVIENANRYYNLYKKTKSSFEYAQSMIEDTKSQIMYYEEQKFFALNSCEYKDLKDIYNEFYPTEEKNTEKDINIENVEYKGYRIYIGKNKKQNDYILSKLSSGEDLWFHTLNSPGAHVLVKVKDKFNVSDEVLLKAAILTKEYSSQKMNSKTSIIYTKRKYVKKATNKIAFVTYKNETEILV